MAEEEVTAELIKKVIEKGTRVIGSWPTAACDFIRQCLEAGGIPQFVPTYAGEPWEVPIPGREVLVRCWVFGVPKGPKPKGGFITNVPEDVIRRMEMTQGDYRWILEEYCP